ncbi:MAG: hypothetical protein DU429_08230 [Candidatus Tokpelaia sp.]|nr:MAG: hypothetical protein DU430_08920 [Candidatus Tokpelaia sp.]KAA6205347.1 MAG: hypothetical protein DU429_08230 [Candidatus Tokpelaia sp.]
MTIDRFITPMPTGLPRQIVENLAEKAAAKPGFKAGDDIFATVKGLGGTIKSGSGGDEDSESGSLIAKSLSDWKMYLSPIASLA